MASYISVLVLPPIRLRVSIPHDRCDAFMSLEFIIVIERIELILSASSVYFGICYLEFVFHVSWALYS